MNDVHDVYQAVAAFVAHRERQSALARQAFAANKTALFAAFAARGIAVVTVRFDGAGDSGQIEAIEAHDACSGAVLLPDEPIAFRFPADDLSELSAKTLALPDVIEAMAYDLLGEKASGWENDDGAYGEFRFDVTARAITLDYRERYVTEDRSVHEF